MSRILICPNSRVSRTGPIHSPSASSGSVSPSAVRTEMFHVKRAMRTRQYPRPAIDARVINVEPTPSGMSAKSVNISAAIGG